MTLLFLGSMLCFFKKKIKIFKKAMSMIHASRPCFFSGHHLSLIEKVGKLVVSFNGPL